MDAGGRFIMPGLIDAHCHISSNQDALPGMRYTDSQEYATLWTARAVGSVLNACVTSISLPGGKWYVSIMGCDAVNAGLLAGPRICCAGIQLGPIGDIFDSTHPAIRQQVAEGISVTCDNRDDYLRAVRLQANRGVNTINVADS